MTTTITSIGSPTLVQSNSHEPFGRTGILAMRRTSIDAFGQTNSQKLVLASLTWLMIALTFGTATAQADLIVNGSFESPAVPPNPGFVQFAAGSLAISDWQVVGQDVLSLHTTYSEIGSPFFTGMVQFNSQDGNSALDLTGGGNTNSSTNGVRQTIATVAGTTYLLEFYVGRAQSNNGSSLYQTPATLDLSIDGGARTGFTNSNSVAPGFVGWQKFSTSFNAIGTSTTIEFLNGTPATTNYLGLDNVSLSAIPEPAGLSLVGLAAISVIGFGRRQRGLA
jgi:hypothetical protein